MTQLQRVESMAQLQRVERMAQLQGVESREKVNPKIPRNYERLRDAIFSAIGEGLHLP